MSMESGEFCSLEGTGRVFWKMIDKTMTLGSIAARLSQIYSADEEAIIKDLSSLACDLEAKRMLSITLGKSPFSRA